MPVIRRRKLPTEVDTIQWTGANEAEVRQFTGGAFFYVLSDSERSKCGDPEATASVYDRLHSTWILLRVGHHVVRGVEGECYPITDDVVSKTYGPASDLPDRRPYRRMSDPGSELTLSAEDCRTVFRHIGWVGQSGAFYSLDESPLGDGGERGGVAPLYFPAHCDPLDGRGPDVRADALKEAIAAITEKANALSKGAEEEMRRDLEDLAQEWRRAADTVRELI